MQKLKIKQKAAELDCSMPVYIVDQSDQRYTLANSSFLNKWGISLYRTATDFAVIGRGGSKRPRFYLYESSDIAKLSGNPRGLGLQMLNIMGPYPLP